MKTESIKKFIEDFNSKIKHMRGKDIFTKYFLRGSFKSGFILLFKTETLPDYYDYYFQLDSEDIQYLREKYLPMYHDIIAQEKEQQKIETIEKIAELKDKLKKLTE